jgi:hypothetical protein
VACSEDRHVGRSQSRDTLWQRILREFNRTNFLTRNKDILQSKWKTLNRDCSKFNVAFKRAQRDPKSGESDVYILKRVNQTYRDKHNNTPFCNDEAWNVLHKHHKWDALDAVDLIGDVPSQKNEALFGHDEEPRPIGKKRASKKQISETTTTTGGTTSTEGSFSSFNFGEAMHQEYRAKREDAAKAYRATAERE